MPAWIQIVSLVVCALAGLYLIGLAALALATPARASTFLLAFAKSARVHLVEMATRMLVGAALVIASPRMPFWQVIAAFGLILLATTAVLLCLPWQWHRAFAERVVPQSTRRVRLIGVVSFLIGGLLIAAVIGGAV